MANLIVPNEEQKIVAELDELARDASRLLASYRRQDIDKNDATSLRSLAEKLQKILRGWIWVESNADDPTQLYSLFRLESVNLYAIFEEALRRGGVWSTDDLDGIIAALYEICDAYETGKRVEIDLEPLAKAVRSIREYAEHYLEKRMIREGGI